MVFPKIENTSFPHEHFYVSIPVPAAMRSLNWNENPKYQFMFVLNNLIRFRAISQHKSQEYQCSFLLRFLHSDEGFWPLTFGAKIEEHPPIANAGSDQAVCPGAYVICKFFLFNILVRSLFMEKQAVFAFTPQVLSYGSKSPGFQYH